MPPRTTAEPPMNETDPPVPRFSLLVPAYNEEGAIEQTLADLDRDLADMRPYELIVINDGSVDRTQALIDGCRDRYPQLAVFEHPRNLGYGAALKTGLRRAHSNTVAIIDADGTYPIDKLGELVGLLEDKSVDMVVGSRTGEDVTYPLIRKIPKYFLISFASWIARQKIPDMNSGMRVFRKDVADRFLNIFPDGFSFTTTITLGMLTRNYRVHYEPISYHARVGDSKIRPIRDTLNFVKIIARVGMYFAPLRVLMPAALVLLLGALISFGFDATQGNLTEKTLLLFLFGINTMMFAMLADMIDKRSDG